MLRENIESNLDRVVAIGEIGLDYDRTHFCPKDIQLKYFELQLESLCMYGLPLFLHMRSAADDFLAIMRKHKNLWESAGGVVHSFSGTQSEMEQIIDLGLDIGINGCSLKTEENLNVVRNIPLHRMHLETDAPWCEIKQTHASFRHIFSPVPEAVKKPEKFVAGRQVKSRNEPCNIRYAAEVVWNLHKESGITFEEFADSILCNSLRLFSKVQLRRLCH